ncbi:MAG: aminoglycoside phosphotransferase family protein [DPANN group archaeon]|nr:aminoglycoside phosphotransferase family protein [DPANN group archaeon]
MKDKIKRYFEKLGHENVNIKKVKGAWSNFNTYKVSTNKGDYVLKIITDYIQDETKVAIREYNFLKIFKKITPKIVSFDIKFFGHPAILMEFVHGGTMAKKKWTDEESREVARLLAKVHSTKISSRLKTLLKTTQPKVPISLNAYKSWISKLKDKNAAKKLVKIIDEVVKVKPTDFKPTICHGDFKQLNIINSKSGLKLIDWECTDIEDPAIDFTQIFWTADRDKLAPNKKQRKIMLAEYKKFRKEKANFKERINWYYSNKDILEILWNIRYYIYRHGDKLTNFKNITLKLKMKGL